MALTLAFLASIYVTGAIIIVTEMLSKNVWFEDEDGMLHLVMTDC